MILFIDPDEVKELKIGDSVVRYVEASGDDCARLELENFGDDGLLDVIAFRNALVLGHIRGWSGVVDAHGVEIPYTDENVASLVPHMRDVVKEQVRLSIQARHVEALASGKDSGSDSDG